MIQKKKKNPSLILGTAQLGISYGITNKVGKPSENQAAEILLQGIGLGVSTLDCASAYGDAEKIIGKTLSGNCINGVSVITKLDPLTWIESHCIDDLSVVKAVRDSVERSAILLKTDKIHTLLLHRYEHYKLRNGLIWHELMRIQSEGLVERIGISLYSPDQAAVVLRDPSFQHIQLPLNILDWRWRNPKIIKAMIGRPDLVIHVRSIYLQGLLLQESDLNMKIGGVELSPYLICLDRLVKLLGRKDRVDLCFAYVNSINWVDGIVIGIEDISQLKLAMKHSKEKPLSEYEKKIVDETLPLAPLELLNPMLWNLQAHQ